MKKKNLWRILGFVLVPATAAVALFPLTSCKAKRVFHFEGHTFSSEAELIKYAESKLTREVEIINHHELLNSSLGQEYDRNLDSFHQVANQANAQVQKNEVDDVNLSPRKLGDGSKVADLKEGPVPDREVYRSIDGQTITESEDALKRENYLNCFNNRKEGVFFRNRFYEKNSELKQALADKQLTQNDRYFRLCAKDVDNNVCLYSPAIFVRQNENGGLDNEESIRPLLRNFLKTGLNVVYEVNTNGVKKYYTDISQVVNRVRFARDEYLYLPKNDARSAYVFDIKKNTQHDYYGPYASHEQLGVKQIQNKHLWHTIPSSNTLQPLTLDLQKENAIVSEFFNLLIPDITFNEQNLFNIGYLSESTREYCDFMAKNAPTTWEKVLDINEQLNLGQRKSILLKLPVIYTVITEDLARLKLSQEFVIRTNKYFYQILDFLDKIIYTVFPEIIFQNSDKSSQTKFSVLALFDEINSSEDNYLPSYRLNVSRIKKDFPYFLEAIKVALLGMENGVSLNGHFPYDQKLISAMLKISAQELSELSPAFERIWTTFSAKTIPDFAKDLTVSSRGIQPEQIPLAFVEHILLMHGLSGAFSEEYRRQVKQINADPNSINSTSFFKNVPNVQELITAANGDYGIYFLLKRKPELLAQIRAQSDVSQNQLATLETTGSFFELVASSIEVGQSIIPSLESIVNLVKKLAEMAGISSLQTFASELISIFGGTNLELIKDICEAFSNVSLVVGGLINLISDLWPASRPTPVKKVIYHFLNSDYFIDNNRFYVLPKAEKIDYNEQFLKQLMPPIKISEPRSVSQVYLHHAVYPFTEAGWNRARYEVLHRSVSRGQHEVANVKMYYSLNGTNAIVDELNQEKISIDNLVASTKLFTSRQHVYEQIIKLFSQKHTPEIIDAIKNKAHPYENFNYLPNYEKELFNLDGTFRNSDTLIPLPSVSEEGYVSWCPATKLNFSVPATEDKDAIHYITLSENTRTSGAPGDATSTIDYRKRFGYFFKKIVNENIPFVKKINQSFYQEKFDEINKLLNTNFDQLASAKIQTVFKVKDQQTNQEICFYDQHDAIDYFIKNNQFRKDSEINYQIHLIYDHQTIFKDLASFHNWVKSKMTTS